MTSTKYDSNIQKRLIQRKIQGTLRSLKTVFDPIDFGSNDSLGLARSTSLQRVVSQELEKLKKRTPLTGFSSTGSRLLAGNHPYAERLEESIAHFHGFEAGLLFNCGYMANVGLLSSLSKSIIFYDVMIHASTHDGIRLSKAKAFPFRHNDLDHLETRLKKCSGQTLRFVCIESVYSTDGSMAPLEEICKLCAQFEAHLIVDESHAIGVFGPQGRGLVAEKKLTHLVFALVTSFAKALGAHGAIVMGGHQLKQYLLNFANSLIYTTALPLQNLAVIKCAYEMLPSMEEERLQLQSLIQCALDSPSQIQPYIVKGNDRLNQCAKLLLENGFFVSALRSPTVRRGHESLRISLHAFNTKNQVTGLLNCIDQWERLHD